MRLEAANSLPQADDFFPARNYEGIGPFAPASIRALREAPPPEAVCTAP
jgi:hypothetical protein